MSDLDDIVFRRQSLSDGHIIAILSAGIAVPSYDEEDFEDDTDDEYVAPMVFRMSYLSSSGVKSDRVVRLLKLENVDRDVRVSAWCYHRRAYRSFLLSRIFEISDVSTGEVFEDARVFLTECGALKAETPEAKALRLCSDELAILAFVGNCDGLFRPEEKDEIVKHICYSSDEPLDEPFIRARIASIAPDEKAFRSALKRLKSINDERRRALQRSLRRVIDADGIVHQAEADAASIILRAFE
jgi:hypothetical protein